MFNLCKKYKLNPGMMRDFINETLRIIKFNENAKKNDYQYKIMKPYLDAIKDLLENGDIKDE